MNRFKFAVSGAILCAVATTGCAAQQIEKCDAGFAEGSDPIISGTYLNKSWQELMPDVLNTSLCAHGHKTGQWDCEFVRDDGLAFLIFEGQITRVELRRENFNADSTLPFDLTSDVSPLEALEKIAQSGILPNPLELSYVNHSPNLAAKGLYVATTTLCQKDVEDGTYFLSIIFDADGLLQSIRSRVLW